MTTPTPKRGRPRVDKIQIGDRFISKGTYERNQKYNPATGCTEWTGVKNSIGYPFIGYTSPDKPRGGMMTAHRIALALKLGRDIAPGMNANHSCHNRLCMSWDHLHEGTQSQKRADMVRDGVKNFANRGPLNKKQQRNYKYTEADIQWIRNSEAKDIAAKYGISIRKAMGMRYTFRRGYTWLPWDKK